MAPSLEFAEKVCGQPENGGMEPRVGHTTLDSVLEPERVRKAIQEGNANHGRAYVTAPDVAVPPLTSWPDDGMVQVGTREDGTPIKAVIESVTMIPQIQGGA